MQQIIQNDFLPLFLAYLHSGEVFPEYHLSNRYKLVKEIEAYMMTHLHWPLTLQDLCTSAGCQSRTLQLAFLEVLGIKLRSS